MIDFVGTDAHLNPNEPLPEQVKQFIHAAREKGARVVFGGDTFNLLPWGIRHWSQESSVVKELVGMLEPGDEFIAGNHDPLPLLKDILPRDRFEPKRQLDHTVGERQWVYTHGHQRSDWFIWRLFAPALVEYMVEHHSGFWYWLCRKLRWLPGREKEKQPRAETQRYTMLTRGVQSAWETFGERNGFSVVIGHTHKAKMSTTWLSDVTQIGFLDAGDLRDWSYAVVTPDEAKVAWLKPTG